MPRTKVTIRLCRLTHTVFSQSFKFTLPFRYYGPNWNLDSFITHSFLCVVNEPQRTSVGRLHLGGQMNYCSMYNVITIEINKIMFIVAGL